MAMLCASSSFTSTKPSCSYSARNGTSICTTPFVAGFSFSQSKLKPCVKTSLFPLNKGSRSFEVRCEKKEKNVVTRVPLDQRWLFEESELNGPDIWNTTWYPKAADHINTEKTWYVVDATDKILGRLASTIAIYIRGKNLATYTPSVDMGAFVIVVNAEKVAVSGKKRTQKLYRRHSGRPGGMKVETFDQLQQRIPERIIEHAVRGMLPKGRLGRALFNHLKVYTGPTHPHEAQKPIDLPIRDKRIQIER
ncbi:PREDICTED: 50S ribosomal protein L13, chloroplastic-like isoform X1 [Populus euphratica]|uniref:Large ribosomal subunit protein uL13c n=1 Tax=Populus euphratica TaxID=75702 RepID=A0AAJ6X1Z1_POPEU|nr:PREDICTED: 50S ribosomal protein L13, chloroplastic-like isoform X1 [Populus euphratica]